MAEVSSKVTPKRSDWLARETPPGTPFDWTITHDSYWERNLRHTRQ